MLDRGALNAPPPVNCGFNDSELNHEAIQNPIIFN